MACMLLTSTFANGIETVMLSKAEPMMIIDSKRNKGLFKCWLVCADL